MYRTPFSATAGGSAVLDGSGEGSGIGVPTVGRIVGEIVAVIVTGKVLTGVTAKVLSCCGTKTSFSGGRMTDMICIRQVFRRQSTRSLTGGKR